MSKSRVFFFFQSAFAFLFCTLLPVKAVIKHLLHEHYQTQAAVLHSRRGLQMLFQHKFDNYVGRQGPLSFPTPRGGTGLLRGSCSWVELVLSLSSVSNFSSKM